MPNRQVARVKHGGVEGRKVPWSPSPSYKNKVPAAGRLFFLKLDTPTPPRKKKVIKYKYPTCFFLLSPRLGLSLPLHFSLSASSSSSSASCPTLSPLRCASLPRRPQGRGDRRSVLGVCEQLSDAALWWRRGKRQAAVQCGSLPTWLQSRC